MNIDDFKKFFEELKPIIDRNKYTTEERKRRGDFFNIFSILGMEKTEVKTHSAFLTELLNPNGTHGLGYKFLLEFINIILPTNKRTVFPNSPIKVIPEHFIGNINEDEGGRIDIFIETDLLNIIIENKIEAKDEPKQLIRYYNYADKCKKDFVLLYLTLDGKQASTISTKGKNINGKELNLLPITQNNPGHYHCISYKDNIRKWLERCHELSANFPLVRETIKQYINLIKKITNTGNNMGSELSSYLANKENIKHTALFLDLENEIKKKIMESVADSIIMKLEESYTSKWGNIIDNDGTFRIYPEDWPLNNQKNNDPYFTFCFNKDGELYLEQYGIKEGAGKLSNKIIEKENEFKKRSKECNYVFKWEMDGCSILGRHKIQDGEKFETKISEETHNVILAYIKELVDFINNNQELLQEIQVDNTIYANYKSLNEILLPLK